MRHSAPQRLSRRSSLIRRGGVAAVALTLLVALATLQGHAQKPADAATVTAPSVSVVVNTPQSQPGSYLVSGKITTTTPVLLVAYLASDSPDGSGARFSSVTGCGLTWSLAQRANAVAGPVEIWSAPATSALSSCRVTATRSFGSYLGQITVVGYANAGGIGAHAATSAAGGAPQVTLTTTAGQSLVAAVGDDWDQAIARQPVSGQSLVGQYLAPVGDTYWTQAVGTPVASRSAVTVKDGSPTSDRFNYAAVEILPVITTPTTTTTLTTTTTSTTTATASPTPTSTATASPTPTSTATASPTPTSTATASPTPTSTASTTTSSTSSSGTTAWARGLAWYQANTGVPAGTALTSSGSLTVTKAGTVIDGLNVNGGITVAASNVTIRNSRVTGTIQMNSGSMLVDHVEIDLSGLAVDSVPQQHGIFYFNGNAVVQFSKIHGMEQGIAWGGTGTFQDNYIYGIRTNTGHSEAILSNGGTSTTLIARNWLDSSGTGAISGPLCMYGDFGQITNVTVDGNLMTGVGYNYFGSVAGKAYPLPSNVTVTNNTFLPPFTWGSPVYPSSLDAQSTSKWSNNRLTTGAAVPAP